MKSNSVAKEFCELSIELLEQAMVKIRHCLDQLDEDRVWWRTNPSINSIGNLCLHLSGNLRQWGVVPLTDGLDNRNRETEFSGDIRASKATLMSQLETVVGEAKNLWLELDGRKLQEKTTIQGFEVSFMQAISHTSNHFVGHTHQIIMLTRMQLGKNYKFQWSPDAERGQLPI